MPDWKDWYDQLKKPRWTPPPKLIGIIWTILYPIIFVADGIVFYMFLIGTINWMIVFVFVINLILNLAFTPIQFGLKNLVLASFDIALVLATIVLEIIFIYPYSILIVFLLLPYLAWVSIATITQFTIAFMNRKTKPFDR